jgi:hypothetical protein
MTRLRHILATILILALVGCSREDATPQGADAGSAPGDAAGDAPHGADSAAEHPAAAEPHSAGIVPGSYEDWCVEHAVPETKCTRCDASLIAAFKATGDWCGDHGLPKSQCLSCDPTLVIARAPRPEGP